MSMAILRILDVWIDSPLEHLLVMAGRSGRITGSLGQVDVEEGGNVTQIEDAAIAKVDRLRELLFGGDHLSGHEVPGQP